MVAKWYNIQFNSRQHKSYMNSDTRKKAMEKRGHYRKAIVADTTDIVWKRKGANSKNMTINVVSKGCIKHQRRARNNDIR